MLAANLAIVLPTDRIRLSAWQREDVAAEVYVTIEQFDVDAGGRGVLVAWWRILSPGGEKTLKAGESRLTARVRRRRPIPSGAVATLSELVAEFSRQLAQALQETRAAVSHDRFKSVTSRGARMPRSWIGTYKELAKCVGYGPEA